MNYLMGQSDGMERKDFKGACARIKWRHWLRHIGDSLPGNSPQGIPVAEKLAMSTSWQEIT